MLTIFVTERDPVAKAWLMYSPFNLYELIVWRDSWDRNVY